MIGNCCWEERMKVRDDREREKWEERKIDKQKREREGKKKERKMIGNFVEKGE